MVRDAPTFDELAAEPLRAHERPPFRRAQRAFRPRLSARRVQAARAQVSARTCCARCNCRARFIRRRRVTGSTRSSSGMRSCRRRVTARSLTPICSGSSGSTCIARIRRTICARTSTGSRGVFASPATSTRTRSSGFRPAAASMCSTARTMCRCSSAEACGCVSACARI